MAPYQSMLPVRRHRAPPSALPRPVHLPTSSSINTHPPVPPTTPGRSLYDLSRFDLDALLDSPASHGHGALIDQAEPSWLADQSVFTVGARTPARARATPVLDDESMLQDGTFARAGDSDGEAAHDDLVETVDHQLDAQVQQAEISPSPTPEPTQTLGQPPPSPSSFAAPLPAEPSAPRDIHAPSPTPSREPVHAEASSASSAAARPEPVAPKSPSPSVARQSSPDQAPAGVDEVDTARARSASHEPAPPHVSPLPVDRRASLDHLWVDAARPLAAASVAEPAPPARVVLLPRDLSDVVEEPENVSAPRSPIDESARQPSPAPAAVAPRAAAAPTSVAPPAECAPASTAPQLTNKPPAQPALARPVQPAPIARPSLAPASRAPRPPVASSSFVPPPVEPAKKRPAAEKGVHDVDEDAKRRVREAKAERERAARERKERLEREAAAKKVASRRQKGSAQDKVEAAQGEKAAAAAAHEPVAAPGPASSSAPTSARTSFERIERVGIDSNDDSPLPVFAFDADSSLPSMGAPLDFARSEHVHGGLGVGEVPGVTSTPARPAKRKADDERAVEKVVTRAPSQPEIETREATLGIQSRPAPRREAPVASSSTEVKLEAQDEGDESGQAPLAPPKRRGRPSRIALAPAGSSDLAASISSTRPHAARPSMGKAVRVVLVAPAPAADPGAGSAAGPALLAASTSSSSGALSRSQRRASRVPVEPGTAAGAPPPPGPPVALNTSTSSRRAGRSSLAPPPPTPPTKHTETMLVVESARTDETVSLSASGTLKASTRRASRIFKAVEEEQIVVQEPAHGPTSSTLSASVPLAALKPSHSASSSRPRAASMSHPLVPSTAAAHAHVYAEPPRVAPPPGKVIGGVTLPSSFSFADAESELAAVRWAERVRRTEEKERRERHAEEVVEERKRKRDEVGAWAVAGGPAKESEGVKRQRLVNPLARSTSSTAPPVHPAPPHLASSSPLPVAAHLALPHAVERSHLRSSSPAAQLAGDAAAPAHEPLLEPEPAVLTREALERNTRRAGPRVDLDRRVSLWAFERLLENVEEEVEEVQEETVAAVAAGAVPQQEEARREQEMSLEQEQEQEQVEQQVQIEQPAAVDTVPLVPSSSTVAIVAAAEPAPVPAAAPSSSEPPAASTRPRTAALEPTRSSTTAAAVSSRRAPPQGPVAAAPAGPRRAQASAPAQAPASPLFTAQLGAWQARERSTLGGGGARGGAARVPAPASAAGPAPPHAAGTRVRRALEAAAPARPGPAKRVRVACASVTGPAPAPKVAPAPVGPRRAPVAVQQAQENAPAAAVGAAAPKTGVAAELEQLRQARAEWSERQKRREEEVKRRREDERKREAEQERNKLVQLRASLARGGPQPAAKGGARRAGRV